MNVRRDRGFTLLELGVAIGVGVILISAVAAGYRGFSEEAKNARTLSEMRALVQAAASAYMRGITVTYHTPPTPPDYSFEGTAFASTATSVCYDLTYAAPNNHCPPQSTNTGSGHWAGSQNTVPASITGVLPSPITNNGYNPYCVPYVMCFYKNRVEVRTCVSAKDANAAMGSGSTCSDACPSASWLTSPTCISLSATPMPIRSQRLDLSFWPTLYTDNLAIFE